MYSVLHELLEDKKGGEIFTLFSFWHFLYILLTLMALIFLFLRCRNKGSREKAARVLIHTAFVMYILDIFLMPLAYGEIDIEKLPFHACTAMCVMSFLSWHIPALKKYRSAFAMLGFLTNLVYLIYPAGVMWHGVHPLSYRVIQTLLFHSVMTVYGGLALAADWDDLGIGQWRKGLTVLVCMTLWALLGNYAYNGESEGYSHFFNWFFVVRDPFYLLPEKVAPFVMPLINIVLFFMVETVLYAIMSLIKRTEKSACDDAVSALRE